MNRAGEFAPSDNDLHRFVWRTDSSKPLIDYKMKRITFGVSASSFAANMYVKQNALDLALEYPQAAKATEESFYVDDCLTLDEELLQCSSITAGMVSAPVVFFSANESSVLKDLLDDLTVDVDLP